MSFLEIYQLALVSLPVDLASLYNESLANPSSLFIDGVINRLVVVLLNEQDVRISNKAFSQNFYGLEYSLTVKLISLEYKTGCNKNSLSYIRLLKSQ